MALFYESRCFWIEKNPSVKEMVFQVLVEHFIALVLDVVEGLKNDCNE